MKINPKTKEVERLFRRLAKDKIGYIDDITFSRNLGRWYPELFDEHNGFMDIARIDKRKKSVVIIRPNAGIAPIESNSSRKRRFTRFQLFKIF